MRCDPSSPGVSSVPSLKISVTLGVLVVALGKNGDSDVGERGGRDDDEDDDVAPDRYAELFSRWTSL